MELKIKKTAKNAVIPQYATVGAACFDLVSTSKEILRGSDQVKYGVGLAFEIPVGYVGLIFPRSSVVKTSLRLGNCVGVIDSDYRGEVSAVFDDNDERIKSPHYEIGDRCCQMMILPITQVEFKEVDELSSTERGEGSYGSTGR